MITLGTHNPGYDVVGSQLKVFIRPVETVSQPSREWPWQPCREKGGHKGRVGITVRTLLETKQKKPKRTQAQQKANTDLTKGKMTYHAQILETPSSDRCYRILYLSLELESIIPNALSRKRNKNKHLSQRYLPIERNNIQFNLTSHHLL